MKSIKVFLSLFIAMGLAACTSTVANLPSNDDLLRELTQQDGRECIRESDISGFGSLSDDIINVNSRRKNEYYLMTTLHSCHSLDSSFQVAFVGKFAEFCAGGGDKIQTRDEACPVKGIYKFESREQAFEAYDIITEKRKALREELSKEQ